MDSSNTGQAPEGVEPHAWAWMSDEDRVSISDTGKALDTEIARVHDLAYDDGIRVLEADRRALRAVYDFGRASRDAEVAEGHERRMRQFAIIGELREQLAAAEAAIQSVRDLADKAEHGALRWVDPLPVPEWVARVRAVLVEPSSVLAAAKADAWDEGYRHAYLVGVKEGATGQVVEYVAPNPYRRTGDTNA